MRRRNYKYDMSVNQTSSLKKINGDNITSENAYKIFNNIKLMHDQIVEDIERLKNGQPIYSITNNNISEENKNLQMIVKRIIKAQKLIKQQQQNNQHECYYDSVD